MQKTLPNFFDFFRIFLIFLKKKLFFFIFFSINSSEKIYFSMMTINPSVKHRRNPLIPAFWNWVWSICNNPLIGTTLQISVRILNDARRRTSSSLRAQQLVRVASNSCLYSRPIHNTTQGSMQEHVRLGNLRMYFDLAPSHTFTSTSRMTHYSTNYFLFSWNTLVVSKKTFHNDSIHSK